MLSSFDDKGKIFTPIISKKPIQVTIQTQHHLICGQVHLRPDNRLIDELNESEKFIAITDVVVFSMEKKEIYRSDFLTINTTQIVWIIPDEELSKTDKNS